MKKKIFGSIGAPKRKTIEGKKKVKKAVSIRFHQEMNRYIPAM